MFKVLIILGLLGYALWYLFAPLITPAALRSKRKNRAKVNEDSKIIDGKGRIID